MKCFRNAWNILDKQEALSNPSFILYTSAMWSVCARMGGGRLGHSSVVQYMESLPLVLFCFALKSSFYVNMGQSPRVIKLC